ncbi:PilZ domain-containing protein [Thalassotalea atypica]|uniref:PilZ domain-containing protein n=1 Tax=Thalassotalea atypica TaxID=2054316 RepID=UPI002572FF0B|nr:PilZ domain-containing protein [Thalassotalea atypica]
MNKDFSQYQKMIDGFRGRVNSADFEARFAESTKNIPKTERFLLKMELKRLASPCTRLIDLRGLVEGDCDTYEHEERTHFLDPIAIKVFEENVAAYGSYTFGVYESVNNTENNFRVIYQKKRDQPVAPAKQDDIPKILEKVQYPAKFHQFGEYNNRCQERMNFAIPLIVTLDDSQKIEASSSDISVSGCKFRFNNAQKVTKGQILLIEFTGLAQEFSFGTDTNFSYEVCNIQHEEHIQMVGVKRIYTKERDGFKQFLQGFIQGNKRRYKINLENTITALQARSLEQFSLPKSSEMPIFMELNQGEFRPRYVLTTNNSHRITQYWQDERHFSSLDCLVTPERFVRIKNASKLGRSVTVFSFIHENQGRKFFYTADEKQFQNDREFMQQFIGFAASKSSFKVTELTFVEVDPHDAISSFTVANTLPKKLDYLNIQPTENEQGVLNRLPYVVVAHDLTTSEIQQEYALLSYENLNTSKLKSLGHKRCKVRPIIDYLGINYRNQRIETRFKYKTPVVVSAETIQWEGISVDFSVSGLKLTLERPAMLKKGEIVHLTFPSLQKITSAFELKKLPYEVVRISKDKTVLNVRVYVEKHQHAGRTFFKALIEKNKDKLTPDEYSMMSPALSKGLRNIYAKRIPFPTLYVQTSGTRYKVEMIAGGVQSKLFTHMKSLSDRPNHYNLYPLMNNLHASNMLKPTLKSLQTNDTPITNFLFISINHETELIENAVTTKLASDFTSTKLRKMFISNALKKGSFYCVQVNLSRAEEPDMDYLNPELSYIGSYAIHRGKQIEQDIWSTIGLIQCFDVTQETLFRYQLIPENSLLSTLSS